MGHEGAVQAHRQADRAAPAANRAGFDPPRVEDMHFAGGGVADADEFDDLTAEDLV